MNCGPTYQELDLGNSGTEGRGEGAVTVAERLPRCGGRRVRKIYNSCLGFLRCHFLHSRNLCDQKLKVKNDIIFNFPDEREEGSLLRSRYLDRHATLLPIGRRVV